MKKVLNESKFIYAINIFIVASRCLLFLHGSHLNTNFIFSVTLTSASMGIVIFENLHPHMLYGSALLQYLCYLLINYI